MKHIIKFVLLVFILSACAPIVPEPQVVEDTYEYQDFAYDIAWSKDESMIALTTLTGLYVYDSKTYEQIFAFEQSGGFGAIFGENYLATANHTGVYIWRLEELETGEILFVIPNEDDQQFPNITITPDDNYLVIVYPNRITTWELPGGILTKTIPIEGQATDIKFKSDTRLILASSFLGTVQEWDISTEKKIREFDFGKAVITLKLSDDASKVLVDYGSNGFEIWDVAKEKIQHGYGDIVSASGWQRLSGDNHYAVVWGYAFDGENGAMSVWDLETHSKTQEFATPFVNGDSWRCGLLNQDGSILVASNNEGYIYFYDLKTGQKIDEIFLPYKYIVEKGQ